MTQFVRFAGCNMRCPLWPCDTPQAIFPSKYIGKYIDVDADELVIRVIAMHHETGAANICLTGGEPFMQPEAQLQQAACTLTERGYTVECFSNGSFIYPDWALENIQFMMDWKLPGSGEGQTKIETRWANAMELKSTDGIKFVIKDEDDLDAAIGWWTHLKDNGCRAEFWIGTAWDRMKEAELVEWLKKMQLPWRLNVQVHKYIWEPERTGV